MDTAERIFLLLDKNGMGQKEFSIRIGCAKSAVSLWKTAGLKSYTKYLPQIADVLGTTVQWLVTGEDPPINQAATPEGSPSPAEEQLLRKYRALSDEARGKLLGYLDALSS